MKEKTKLILKTFSALAITITIFYIIFKNINIFSVIDVIKNANVGYLILALILGIIIILVFAKRWQIVLDSMDYQITFRDSFNIIMSVFPFASITPSVASDTLRAVFLRGKIRASIVIGSLLTERVLEFATLLLFLIIGMAIGNKFQYAGIAIVIFICIALAVYLSHAKINYPFKNIWNERIENVFLSLNILTKHKKYFFIVVGYTILIWILSIIQIMFFFCALGIDVPVFALLTGVPIVVLIGQIPVTLGGAGTRDAAFILIFSEYAPPEQLLSVGLFFSLFRVWLPSLFGLVFMKRMINYGFLESLSLTETTKK